MRVSRPSLLSGCVEMEMMDDALRLDTAHEFTELISHNSSCITHLTSLGKGVV